MNRLLVVPQRTSRTPEDAWVGEPGLFHNKDNVDLAEISCVFTWDKGQCEHLKYQWEARAKEVKVGGPAYDAEGGEFEVGKYVRKGVVHTSRGCPRRCPWCYVWKREGNIRELEIKQGNILEESNLLACSKGHIEKVFEMLKTQRAIEFAGGLDGRLLKDWHLEAIRGLRVKQMIFAYDDKANKKWALGALEKAVKAGFNRNKIRCFVMIGRNETFDEANERLFEVWAAGAKPFAQVWDGVEKDKKRWAVFGRAWSRPAAMKYMVDRNMSADEIINFKRER